MGSSLKLISELLLVFCLFTAISIITNVTQHQITYNQGKGWDGVEYYSLAKQMIGKETLKGDGPYVYRIGTPFLASLIPLDDISLRFKIANIIACLVLVVLLAYWLRLYIPNAAIRLIMMLLFMTQWHAPIRFMYYYPIYTDPWALVFIMAGLILIHKGAASRSNVYTYWVAALSFAGVFFREVVILIPITWWYAKNSANIRQLAHGISGRLFKIETKERVAKDERIYVVKALFRETIPLIAGIAAVIMIRAIVHQSNPYQFTKTAMSWMYDKPILTYVHAWFIAFGPIIVIPLLNWGMVKEWFKTHSFHTMFMIMICILGWVGGSDTERIIYWGMPIVYVIIGLSIVNKIDLIKHSPFLVAFMICVQCISQRILWYIPDYPLSTLNQANGIIAMIGKVLNTHTILFLTVVGSSGNYLDLFSFYSELPIRVVGLFQYVMVCIVLLVWMRIRDISLGHQGFVE